MMGSAITGPDALTADQSLVHCARQSGKDPAFRLLKIHRSKVILAMERRRVRRWSVKAPKGAGYVWPATPNITLPSSAV